MVSPPNSIPTNQLKYGRVERERRFLLDAAPQPLDPQRWLEIEDRYLRDTRLRLRLMRDALGRVAFKLARKEPPHRPGCGVMGNLYLSEDEYNKLRTLDADTITKRRRYFQGWSIDLFSGHLSGLVLAEKEAESEAELDALVPPFDYICEVTADPIFSGGQLARTTPEQLRIAVATTRASGFRVE